MQGASAHLLPDFHGNRGSPGAVALGADTASHTVCKFLYNAKSQSVSRLSALCRIAHIRIKSLPQLFACHSGAGVRHPAADHHIRGIPDCLTGNHTADLASSVNLTAFASRFCKISRTRMASPYIFSGNSPCIQASNHTLFDCRLMTHMCAPPRAPDPAGSTPPSARTFLPQFWNSQESHSPVPQGCSQLP